MTSGKRATVGRRSPARLPEALYGRVHLQAGPVIRPLSLSVVIVTTRRTRLTSPDPKMILVTYEFVAHPAPAVAEWRTHRRNGDTPLLYSQDEAQLGAAAEGFAPPIPARLRIPPSG